MVIPLLFSHSLLMNILVLVTMHSAAVQLCVNFSVDIFHFNFGVHLKMEFLDHSVTMFIYLFFELTNCFPEWFHHFSFLPKMYGGSCFSTSLSAFCYCLFFFFFGLYF